MTEVQSREAITAEEATKLADLMNTKHKLFLAGRQFSVEAERDGSIVNAKVTLSNADRSFHYPVESRMDFVKEDMTQNEAALFLIDYIDLYFEDYFDDAENTFIPIDWTNFFYDATDFQMRGQILNLKVEEMADQFLAAHDTPNEPQPELLN